MPNRVNAPAPPPPKETLARSVEAQTENLFAGPGGGNTFTFWLASIADTFTPWGTDYVRRDQELRDFWHTETFLAGAVYTSAITNSQMDWKLEGPDSTVNAVLDLLNSANLGRGWAHFMKQVSLDIYTQENGAFVEVIRMRDSPEAPVLGLQHLDAARCQRTGDLNLPVIYTDRKGARHKMPWYSVITLEEFPSSVETMFGLQHCAVSRALRAAQILRDMAIYRGEKAGGRFAEAIHVVGGVSTKDLQDVRERAEERADNQGIARYLGPLVIGSLDPETHPQIASLDLKALPESFDLDDEMRWYISSLALAFGRDYQDFAPLPAGNIGTSQQSETLHKKGRKKAAAAFMRMIEQAFNFYGVMPRTVTFKFEEQDLEEDAQRAEIAKTWAETFKSMVDAGVLIPEIARQMLQDEGILKPEYIELIGEEDITPSTPVEGGEKPDETEPEMLTADEVPEESMLKTMVASLRRRAEDFPQFKQMIEDSAREASLGAQVAALTNVVIELQRHGLQGTVDEALGEAVEQIAASTDQTLKQAVIGLQGMFEQGALRLEREMKTTILERMGKEIRDARKDGLEQMIDRRLSGPMRQIASDAHDTLIATSEAMRDDLKATSANMSEGLDAKGRQLQRRLDEIVATVRAENDSRREAISKAMDGLTEAVSKMRRTQDQQAEVIAAREDAERRVKEAAEGMVMVDSEIVRRDKEGRALVVRKTFASGTRIEYDVIRDKLGKVKNLKARS